MENFNGCPMNTYLQPKKKLLHPFLVLAFPGVFNQYQKGEMFLVRLDN